jgi:hypothetical protein
VGLDLIVGPNSPGWTQRSLKGDVTAKATA